MVLLVLVRLVMSSICWCGEGRMDLLVIVLVLCFGVVKGKGVVMDNWGLLC